MTLTRRAKANRDVPLESMNSISELENLLKKAKSNFRFEYVGGGYFRDKKVARGVKADILHGSEVLDELCSEVVRQYLLLHSSQSAESRRNLQRGFPAEPPPENPE